MGNIRKLLIRYKAHDKKVKEAQQNFKVSDIKNKYFRAFMWIIMLKFVWDITTLLEKHLPMNIRARLDKVRLLCILVIVVYILSSVIIQCTRRRSI